jgi:RNA polymerase sigma-70 factor (ECF subfamily)
MAASDAELLRAIATGNEAAFAELRGRYGRAVARVCRTVGPERIWRKAALFDATRGSAAAWLLTLARRTASNFQAARRTALPIEHEPASGVVEPVDVDAFWLDAALARLSERERRVIELAYYAT